MEWKVKLNQAMVSLGSNWSVSALCKEGLLMGWPRSTGIHMSSSCIQVLVTGSVSLSLSPPIYYSSSETVPPKLRFCTDSHSNPEFRSAYGDWAVWESPFRALRPYSFTYMKNFGRSLKSCIWKTLSFTDHFKRLLRSVAKGILDMI